MAQKNWKSTVLSVLDKYDLSSSQHDPDKLGEDFEKFLRSQGLQKNDEIYSKDVMEKIVSLRRKGKTLKQIKQKHQYRKVTADMINQFEMQQDAEHQRLNDIQDVDNSSDDHLDFNDETMSEHDENIAPSTSVHNAKNDKKRKFSGQQQQKKYVSTPIVDDSLSSESEDDTDSKENSTDPDYKFEVDKKTAMANECYSREKIREIVAYWNGGVTKRRTLKCVQHRYRKVSSTSTLYRWQKQIQKGSVVEKRQQIDAHVFKCYEEARKNKVDVHEVDLCRWACEKATVLGLNGFKGSNHWVFTWKKKHGIILRKQNEQKDANN